MSGKCTDDVKMKMILNLSKRVAKLEKEIYNSKIEELDWALNQVITIIERELYQNYKK